MLASVAKLPQV